MYLDYLPSLLSCKVRLKRIFVGVDVVALNSAVIRGFAVPLVATESLFFNELVILL
jgi:hypothetical protein